MLRRRPWPATAAAESAEQRDRAFTLFIRCYDQIRRAILFLRWEQDDADTIAPSLYPGYPRRMRKEADGASESEAEPTGTTAGGPFVS